MLKTIVTWQIVMQVNGPALAYPYLFAMLLVVLSKRLHWVYKRHQLYRVCGDETSARFNSFYKQTRE